ncbi:MAG: endonuclease/exonuclease/phosphatase family protein [Chitinophagaceae bacterium]
MLRIIFKYGVLILNILFATLLLLTRLIPTINPYEQSIIGILGFMTPVLFILNCLFIFIWLFSKKFLYILLSLFAIFFSWKVSNVLIGGHFFCKQDFEKGKNAFSVLSYNVRLLDLYNWSGNKKTHDHILDYLKNKNADVLCLQEFYTGNDSIGINNIRSIQELGRYEYVAECVMNENKRGKWGSVVFSHYPILENINHDIDVEGSNLLQHTTIKINEDTINFYNLHLKSNKFNKGETDIVHSKEIPKVDKAIIEKTKSIYQKLERSSINRGLEASLISNIISKSKRTTVVCGDLNDIPSSYVYFKLRNHLKDAFLNKGKGIGATYNQTIPLLRIDYIFNSSDLTPQCFEIGKETYSDHFPLYTIFKQEIKKG